MVSILVFQNQSFHELWSLYKLVHLPSTNLKRSKPIQLPIPSLHLVSHKKALTLHCVFLEKRYQDVLQCHILIYHQLRKINLLGFRGTTLRLSNSSLTQSYLKKWRKLTLFQLTCFCLKKGNLTKEQLLKINSSDRSNLLSRISTIPARSLKKSVSEVNGLPRSHPKVSSVSSEELDNSKTRKRLQESPK